MHDVAGTTIGDGQLLRQYARQRSEAAFRELVARHLDWVYSSSLRQVRWDADLAEDVTQTVFILLARKAGSFDERVVLSAWLFRAVRYVSAEPLKARGRRKFHERKRGAVMSSTRPPENPDEPQQAWEQ